MCIPFTGTCPSFNYVLPDQDFGDLSCDGDLNVEECEYDGGDCCVINAPCGTWGTSKRNYLDVKKASIDSLNLRKLCRFYM